MTYVQSFGLDAREIFDYFRFSEFLDTLNETNLLYEIAKQYRTIDQQLEQELAEGGAVSYHLPCPGVESRCKDRAVHTQRLAVPTWDAVALEVGYQGYRLDVAVVCAGAPVLGFEVLFSHEVPIDKAEQLELPWLELLAEDILTYRPRVPHRSPVVPYLCESCAHRAQRLAVREADDGKRDAVTAEFLAERERVRSAWRAVLGKARGKT